MLSVVILNVVMLFVIILKVVLPLLWPHMFKRPKLPQWNCHLCKSSALIRFFFVLNVNFPGWTRTLNLVTMSRLEDCLTTVPLPLAKTASSCLH